MSTWLLHSEKRQWKNHEYSERVVNGPGVPGYIYPDGNSNHNTTAKTDGNDSGPSEKESNDVAQLKGMLTSGFTLNKSYEEDGETVFVIETPSGDLHEFVGVPSQNELSAWMKKQSKSSSKNKYEEIAENAKSKSKKSSSSKSSSSKKSSSSSKKSSSDSKSDSNSEKKESADPEAKMKEVLPSGFTIAESYEEDGKDVYIIETPSGDEHKFVGVPSKEEMARWASSVEHSDKDDFYISKEDYQEYLAHHGILGQKWGIRRYQNKDGSLTPEGKARYGSNFEKGVPKQMLKKAVSDYNKRTGSNVSLKDARAIRVGQFLYDRKGRRIQENTNVDASNKYKQKQAKIEEQRQQNQYNQQNQQYQKKGGVGRWIASKATKAVNNITDTALEVGKDYLRKQLREAVGLDNANTGPRDARTKAELLKKSIDNWTPNDFDFYNKVRGLNNQQNQNQKKKKNKP